MVSCLLQVSRKSKSSLVFLSLKSSLSKCLYLVMDEGPYLCLSTCIKPFLGGNLSRIKKVNTKVIMLIMLGTLKHCGRVGREQRAKIFGKILNYNPTLIRALITGHLRA